MNERIFDMARQSGATDENGGRAEHVFCFTKDELKGVAELIVRQCMDLVKDCYAEPGRSLYQSVCASTIIEEHFGVE